MGLVVTGDTGEFRRACDAVRRSGQRLALVPTMGALHEGHLALIDEGKRRAEQVMVTIFVNPTQFGAGEDFARYPRELQADLESCDARGVNVVFAPEVSSMYPPGDCTRVVVSGLTETLCGPHRPGHFEGVATIVAKLFALTGPSVAIFGRKDYQQLRVVEQLARDLFLPVEVVGVETRRAPDGLALSSRNRYLTAEQRSQALAIPGVLSALQRAVAQGEWRSSMLVERGLTELAAHGLVVQYLSVVDPIALQPVARITGSALLAVAAFAGQTRLIDNVLLAADTDQARFGQTAEAGQDG